MINSEIYYTKVGHGPHLCFLHGFCEDQRIWDSVIAQFCKEYTCIAIDLPGFGKSSAGAFKSLPEVVKQIRLVLQNENATETVLFGHSMGGYIVAEYAHQFADELRGAAFIHSTSRSDTEDKKLKRKKTIEFVQKNGSSQFFPIFINDLVAEQNFPKLQRELYEMVSTTSTQSIIDGHTAMLNRADRLESIQRFEKPILFLKGEEDKHYGAADTNYEAAQCQMVQLSSIKNVGHLSMLENSEVCIAEIEQFLEFVKRMSNYERKLIF